MFVAIDRTPKFAFVELHKRATTVVSAGVLRRLLTAVPYKIHTVLADNGIQLKTPGVDGPAVPLIKEAPCWRAKSSGRTPSNSPAPRPTSSTGRPSRNIRGPTAKSNGCTER